MRTIPYLVVISGLGLAVLLCGSGGLAAATGSQTVAPAPAPQPAVQQAAVAPPAAPVPWAPAAAPARSGAKTVWSSPAGRQTAKPRSAQEFIASLREGEPVPASSCYIATSCYCGGVVSCSGSTCFKSLGCYVTCDDVEYDCPGCSEPYCA